MKKIIIPLIILFFIFFLIGLFFSKKESTLKIVEENTKQKTVKENEKQKEVLRPFGSESSYKSESSFILEFERKINEEINKLTEKIKPDENKSITDYANEIAEIQKKMEAADDIQKIDADALIEIAKKLTEINPPPILYSFHLEIIKIYYQLGTALKEFEKTDDQTKKLLLYNLIRATLKKIKF